MKIRICFIFIIVVGVPITAALIMYSPKIKTDTNKTILPSIDDVPREYWEKLAGKKIFFGHKSVGYNIIDGIKDVVRERDYIKLNIVETHEPVEFDQPIFAHSQVGKNAEPASKIESFENIIDSGVGAKVDIAFFKFCYADITHNTNTYQMFEKYNTTIKDLKTRYPKTNFIHVTVPLRSSPKGAEKTLKETIKSLIGKPVTVDNNIKRQHYNSLLNETYSETEPVFDLALIESINPDGAKCYVTKGTNKVFFMAAEYTNDGGHLNEKGRKKVAEQLLIFLAKVVNKSSSTD